jgi:hypothetical protein
MAGDPTSHEPEATAPPHTWRTVSFGRSQQWSLPQLALGLVGVASALVFLEALWMASGGFDALWWLLAVVPLVTLPYAGSGVPLAFWGLMLLGWFLLTPSGSFSAWSVPAALALVVGHSATSLSATTPPAGGFSRGVLRRWLAPLVLAGVSAPLVAILASAVRGDELAASPAAYVIGLGGLALGVFLLRSEPPLETV